VHRRGALAMVMMVHSGSDGMARAGDGDGTAWSQGVGMQGANSAGEGVNGDETRRTVAGGNRIDGLITGEREGDDERDRVVSGRADAREKERARLTGGVGRSAGEGWARRVGGHAEGGSRGPGGGGVRVCGREKGRRLGPDSAQPRGDFLFFFSFYFLSISISFFL
jgi:hypothetical protein